MVFVAAKHRRGDGEGAPMIQWEHLQEESNVNGLSMNIRNHNTTSITSCFLPTLVRGHLVSLSSSTNFWPGGSRSFQAAWLLSWPPRWEFCSFLGFKFWATPSRFEKQFYLPAILIFHMIGLGQQDSGKRCCEATDVVGILFLFNLALWILWLPDSPVVLLHITAAIAAFLKAASSFDWSQQLSQLSLRQVGSDFCSQFISDHLSSKICVDLSCFGGYADSTTPTG